MTTGWLRDDYGMTTGWLRGYYGMTTGWLQDDYGMTTGWLRDPYRMTTGWLQDDYRWLDYGMTTGWLRDVYGLRGDYGMTTGWLRDDYEMTTGCLLQDDYGVTKNLLMFLWFLCYVRWVSLCNWKFPEHVSSALGRSPNCRPIPGFECMYNIYLDGCSRWVFRVARPVLQSQML